MSTQKESLNIIYKIEGVNIPLKKKRDESVGRGRLNFPRTQSNNKTHTNFVVITRQTIF